MKRSEQLRLGSALAKRLPHPTLKHARGVNVITQEVEGLTADELLALSEFYRREYGQGA